MGAPKIQISSFIWKSILKIVEVLKEGFLLGIGQGQASL